jgi:hypothetical protein
MEACPRQLLVLKAILSTFADSIGLKVIYSKSNMIPINLSGHKLSYLASTFQCKAGHKHLGTGQTISFWTDVE